MKFPRGARGPRINCWALRAMRINAGLTQGELAKQAAIVASTLSRLETGERTHPTPRILKGLAEALGVPVAALMAVEHNKASR